MAALGRVALAIGAALAQGFLRDQVVLLAEESGPLLRPFGLKIFLSTAQCRSELDELLVCLWLFTELAGGDRQAGT